MFRTIETTVCLDVAAEEVERQVRDIALVARPQWSGLKLVVNRFDDGYSNTLFGCGPEGRADEKVCVRVNGEVPKTKSPSEEIAELSELASCGLGAPIFAKFQNGLCYGYRVGRTITDLQMSDERISEMIARRMAQLHAKMTYAKLQAGGVRPPHRETKLVSTLRSYLDMFPDTFADAGKQELFTQVFPQKAALQLETEELLAHLDSLSAEITFCHNDLMPGNIILNQDEIHFIDYEYAGWNCAAYDIANHFDEYAGVHPQPDHDRYPKREHQFRFLKAYLTERKRLNSHASGQPESDVKVDMSEVERLYVHVQNFSLAAHLFWAVWTVLIAHARQESELNFLGYSVSRFMEYRRAKKERFGTKLL